MIFQVLICFPFNRTPGIRSPHTHNFSSRGILRNSVLLMMTYFELNQICLIHKMEISVVETMWKRPSMTDVWAACVHSHVNQNKGSNFIIYLIMHSVSCIIKWLKDVHRRTNYSCLCLTTKMKNGSVVWLRILWKHMCCN